MSKYLRYSISFFILFQLSTGCKDRESDESVSVENADAVTTTGATVKEEVDTSKILVPVAYEPASVNDALAEKIKQLLKNDYLKADIGVIDTSDRKFNIYEVDLNNDQTKETFVNLYTPYFCGTGGCTVLLLDNNLKLMNRFTVTETPLYIDPAFQSKWKVIYVKSKGQWKSLTYTKGKYPSNPSVATNSEVAPQEESVIIFKDNHSSKTYSF